MKVRIYLKIGKTLKGHFKAEANTKPNMKPIKSSSFSYTGEWLPTIIQALDVIVPDDSFEVAKNILEVRLSEIQPAVDVEVVE